MIKNIKQKEEEILTTISNIKENKNPLNVLFIISDIKKIFSEIGDSLLDGLDLTYSRNFRENYENILEKYKSVETFEETYEYYTSTHSLSYFKKQIDDYFENSFFIDLSFFYYTLSFDPKYFCLFSAVKAFYLSNDIRNHYYSLHTFTDKVKYIQGFLPKFEELQYQRDKLDVINFLNQLEEVEFQKIPVTLNINEELFIINLMKYLTIEIFKNKENNPDTYDHILNQFVNNPYLSDKIIDKFEDEYVFKVISFLRNDILSEIDSNEILSYSTKKIVNKYLREYGVYELMTVDERIQSYIERQNYLTKIGEKKGNFIRLYLKRRFLEENYRNIIDLSLGILFLPQEIFYQYKSSLKGADVSELSLYNQVKELILYVEDSYFLGFLKPFLLMDLSKCFNNNNQKYYIVKFLMLVILSSSYTEYKKLQKFFYNLEIFFRKDLKSLVKKIFIFGWIGLFFGFLYLIAPFGVILGIVIIALKEVFLKGLGKVNPELKLNLNFQTNSLVSLIAMISVVLGGTIGFEENTQIIYENLKGTINALTLNSNETTKLLKENLGLLKTSVLSNGDIELKNTFEQINLLDDSTQTKNIEISNNENIQKQENIISENKIISKSDYANVLIDKNNTFWDYGVKIALENNIDTKTNDFDKKLFIIIENFLTKNRDKISAYCNIKNSRLSVWELTTYLPAINFDISELENEIKNI